MHNAMFKITNPENKAKPWRGKSPAIQTKPAFNDYIIKNLGSIQQRELKIRKFMEEEDVKQMLGAAFIKKFLQRPPMQWFQQRPLAIDFANSG